MHPVSKTQLFQKSGMSINSITLNGGDPAAAIVRHLFYQQIDESITLPVYMIMLKIIWRRANSNSVARIVSGIIDLSDLISNN